MVGCFSRAKEILRVSSYLGDNDGSLHSGLNPSSATHPRDSVRTVLHGPQRMGHPTLKQDYDTLVEVDHRTSATLCSKRRHSEAFDEGATERMSWPQPFSQFYINSQAGCVSEELREWMETPENRTRILRSLLQETDDAWRAIFLDLNESHGTDRFATDPTMGAPLPANVAGTPGAGIARGYRNASNAFSTAVRSERIKVSKSRHVNSVIISIYHIMLANAFRHHYSWRVTAKKR